MFLSIWFREWGWRELSKGGPGVATLTSRFIGIVRGVWKDWKGTGYRGAGVELSLTMGTWPDCLSVSREVLFCVSVSVFLSVCPSVCLYIFLCSIVYVCVRERECVGVCVCVFVAWSSFRNRCRQLAGQTDQSDAALSASSGLRRHWNRETKSFSVCQGSALIWSQEKKPLDIIRVYWRPVEPVGNPS